MQSIAILAAMMASLVTVDAVPATEMSHTINLFNGDETVPVTVYDEPETGLEKRVYETCKGSRYCSNDQKFKNSCYQAYNEIESTTYTSKGTQSGVCYGYCGLFVAVASGKNTDRCHATGSQLQQAYNNIRSDGCEACGVEYDYGQSGCVIKIDYVRGCSAGK